MASAEEYAKWIVENQDRKGTPEFDTVAKAYTIARQSVATPAAQPKEESPYSVGNIAGAAVEPSLAIASGALAAPVSGIAGLATGVGNALGLTDKAPADVVRSVGNAMTYEPRTSGGQTATNVITKPFQLLAKGADIAGSKAAELTGSPAVGAGVNTAIQMAAPAALVKGAGKIPLRRTGDINPDVRMLADKGITMTPGQIKGGALGTLEQAFQSVPFFGDIVKNARGQGTTELNRVVVNDALAPVGVELPKGVTGQEAVKFVRETLSEKYDSLLPKMRGSLDSSGTPGPLLPGMGHTPGTQVGPKLPTLRDELTNLKQMGQSLPRQQRADLNRIIDNEIIDKFTDSGLASGETIKDIQSVLSKEIADYGRGGTYELKLAQALKEAQSSLRRMIERENPEYAGELSKINDAYGKFKIVQRAASLGKDGMFTPVQLLRAIKQKDITKDKRAFSEGDAGRGMQPLADAARNVLPTQLADSGTPTRLLTAHALLGGGLAHFLNPMAALTAGVIPAAYSGPGLSGLQSLLFNPPSLSGVAARAAPIGLLQNSQK